MVKYIRRKRQRKAVLSAISKYQRRKLNYITDLYWSAENKLFIDGEEKNAFIIGEALLGNQNEFLTLGKQFAFVKLRGILVEAVNDGTNGGYNYGVCIGNTNDVIAFGNLRTQPNILLFDRQKKSRMFVKVNSEFTSTNSIELFNNVALLPFRQSTGTARFSLKITLYLTFKTST